MNSSFWNTAFLRTQMWAALAAFAMLIMEPIVVALWYQAVFEPSQVALHDIAATLFLIMSASFLLLRLMDTLHLRMITRQVIFLAWIGISAFTSLKLLIYPAAGLSLGEVLELPLRYILRGDVASVNFFHMVWVILLIWRSVVLSRAQITINSVQASFQLGLVLMLVYGLIYAPYYPVEAVVGLYLFLFFGLFGMSMARIANLSELRGGRVPRFGAGWILSVVLAALSVVGLAILFGWLSSGSLVAFLAQVLIIIFAILAALLLLILSPLLISLSRVLPLLADFLEELLARFRSLPFSQQLVEVIETLSEGLERAVTYLQAARGLLLLIILAVIALAVLLALYLRARQSPGEEEEESEFAEPGRVDNFFQKILQRLRSDARRLGRHSPAQLLAAARIRRIYRQLMELSEKLGSARPPSVTPLEFLPELEALFPGQQAGLNAITAAYLKVRYGAVPETGEEVQLVQAAWDGVRKQGRKSLALIRRTKKKG